MKRLVSALLAVLLLAVSLGACGEEKPQGADVYRMLYSSEFTTMNYLTTGNTNEMKVLANLIDGLTDYDKYGVVQPALAESWSHNEDYTVWTFNIRKGVKWVDSTGKEIGELTAQDWVTAGEYVNQAKNNSGTQYMFTFVKNADKYYEDSSIVLAAENAVKDKKFKTVEDYYAKNNIDPQTLAKFEDVGVKAKDTYILEYTMEAPCPFFVSVVSYASYLPLYKPFIDEHEADFGQDNTTILYNGGYIMSSYVPNVERILTQNPLYWDAENITIKSIEYTYNLTETTIAPTMVKSGDIDFAYIGADILQAWMEDPATKDLIHPSIPDMSYSYFYNFNFEPRFDKKYEPENWIKAVNNENFRKSLFYALDRELAASVKDPYNPKSLLNNTITPKAFAFGDGTDYTQYAPLKTYSDTSGYNETEALKFKELAVKELTAEGAAFPVKVLMPYNPSVINWDKECIVVEQQLEKILGTDYIDIIVEAGPSTGFLTEIRRSGKYAFMKCNWGADFSDPQTWTEAFTFDNSYGFFYTNPTKLIGGAPASSKTAQTQALVTEYYGLTETATKSTSNIKARYEAFAKAEAFLIEHAFFIPFSIDTDGYVSDTIDPFTRPYSPFGLAKHRFKGVSVLSKPMNTEEFSAAYDAWLKKMADKQ